MAIAEISVVPIGTKTPSLSKYVARVLQVLQDQKEVTYELTAMGTILEGDLDKVMKLIQKMHESAFSDEIARVVTTIKIDDRRDKVSTRDSKIKSVEKELGQTERRSQ
ncbi:MAG: MTH1187 family thiamine-binding protein [Dehalococcoidia bacterium]